MSFFDEIPVRILFVLLLLLVPPNRGCGCGGGGGGQLKFWPFFIFQLNFMPFVSCRLNDYY